MKILFFRLEGLLQSWGESSKWDCRDTSHFPTKSGIVGLVGCAMGIKRGDEILKEISEKIDIAVRGDRGGQIDVDFHTVTSLPMLTAEKKEKKKNTPFTIITPRKYLSDASFLVAISSSDEGLLDDICAALSDPKWPIYLGRACCTPSVPVIGQIRYEYDSLHEAMEKYPFVDEGCDDDKRRDNIIFAQESGSDFSLLDEIQDVRKRTYNRRGVCTYLVKRKGEGNVFK